MVNAGTGRSRISGIWCEGLCARADMDVAHGEPHACSDQVSISGVIGLVLCWSDRCCHDGRCFSTQTVVSGSVLLFRSVAAASGSGARSMILQLSSATVSSKTFFARSTATVVALISAVGEGSMAIALVHKYLQQGVR